MTQPDKPKSAPSRKKSKKAQAPESETPPVVSLPPPDPAQQQAVELHSGAQELSRRAADLENRVGDLELELQKARDEAGVAGTRNAELQQELQKARDHAGLADTRIVGLDRELAEARNKASETEARGAGLDRRIDDLGRELKEARGKTAAAEARAAGLNQDLEKARDEAGAASLRTADLKQELAEARNKASEAEARLQKSSGEADAAGARSAGLDRRLEDLDRELKEARNKSAAAEAQAAGLNQDLQKACESAAELDRELKQTREEAEARVSELETLVDGLEEESRAAGESAAEGDARVAELEAELLKVREEADQASAKVAELEQKVGELDPELEKAWDDVDRAEARAVEQERQSQELSARQAALIAGLEEESAGLGRQLEEARRRVMEFTEEHHTLFGEQKKTLESLDAATKTNDELQTQAVGLNDRIKSAEAKIAEAAQRIDGLQRELADAKKWEAKAREWESTATQLKETSGGRLADLVRFEKTRVDQEQRLGDLGQRVKELERELQEAESSKAAPAAEGTPPDAEPASDEPIVIAYPESAVETPPAPAPVAVPRASEETNLRPQNYFGPVGEDGQPRHVLMEVLSKDSMGVLYRACERATHRQFAVRFMAGQAGEAQTVAIERTVEKLLSLPHPNILHVQGSGRRKNRLYLEIDLVEAPTLGQAKIQEIPRIVAILRDVAAAVHYAHEEGILHGDLNPENILVQSEESGDHALVKDFGLAYLLESLVPASSGKDAPPVIRNPAFLSPEQARVLKPALGVPADVYGLGVTLYAVLAGRPPFEGKDVPQVLKRVMIEEPVPLERLRPEVPEALGAVVRRAMAKERGLRYGSAQDMADALTKVLGE